MVATSEKKRGRPAGEKSRVGGQMLGARLRLTRLEASMTQNELAGRVGVRESAVSSWESGTVPSALYLLRICREVEKMTPALCLECLEYGIE